jgi:DNA-directed RNA polymerase specialized sigma24 family protein
MDSEPTDKDLLSRLSTDPAAFETFYWRHLDRVIGFTAHRVRIPADVADVVAATFLTVLTAARSYDPGRGEPTAWLLGIAARLIANEDRRRRRESSAAARIVGHRLVDASDHQLPQPHLEQDGIPVRVGEARAYPRPEAAIEGAGGGRAVEGRQGGFGDQGGPGQGGRAARHPPGAGLTPAGRDRHVGGPRKLSAHPDDRDRAR